MATRGKNATQDPPPPYFIVSATCSSVSVCFIDYDPSVENMGVVAGIKANTPLTREIHPMLSQYWASISTAVTTLSAQGRFDL